MTAGLAGLVLAAILAALAVGAAAHGGNFSWWRLWTDATWHPHVHADRGSFGLGAIVAGSLAVTAGAMGWSVPASLCTAVGIRFFVAGRSRAVLLALTRLLAQIPSVVFGLWGLSVWVPLVAHWAPPGSCWAVASLVLGMMLLPTMTLWFEAALSQVPGELFRAAAALGLSRETVAFRVAIPACRSALAAATLFALVRALGETMAVMMVSGNVPVWPTSPWQPVRTATATIALEMGYAEGVHRAVLFACGLVLLATIMVCVGVVERVLRRLSYLG